MRAGGNRLFRPESPHSTFAPVGQPHIAMTNAHGISTGSVELRGYLISVRIDPRHRDGLLRYPHRAFAGRDVSAGAGNADFNRCGCLHPYRLDLSAVSPPLAQLPTVSFPP